MNRSHTNTPHTTKRVPRRRGDEPEFLGRVMVGWDDIQAHDGKPLAFSKKTLGQLCDIRYWATAVVNDYLAFHRGEPAKN